MNDVPIFVFPATVSNVETNFIDDDQILSGIT